MFKHFILSVLLLGAATASAQDQPREVVLVVSRDSPVTSISSLELRKLYLGLPVTLGGVLARPLRNASDDQLEEIFYQSAMAMSRGAYERQLLSLTLRFGRLNPEIVHSTRQVKEVLYQDVSAISYMWHSDIGEEDELRIVKLLWLEH
jgi:hypothetical protein